MKIKTISKHLIFSLLMFSMSLSAIGQKETNKRAEWFVDSRFGMFIHWGIYSGAEGIWKGEKLRNDNNYAEWIYYRNRIAKDEYVTLLNRFDWDKIDPEEWVLLAKKAGMKYVTITSKHHDGFALWNSKVSDYNVSQYTSPSRDIIKELADACKKHGLKMGLYYSHWMDWEDPYGWDHSKEIYKITDEEYDIYWQNKVMPQMRELLSNYGEIGMFWFDMWMHHSKSIVTKDQLMQLKGLIRELQPNCLVNSRIGLSIEEDSDVDFKSLRDNQLGSKKEDFPWQTSGTVAHSWGYDSYDNQWKSTSTLLHVLINNVSLNGNYMLNIGPRANGDVPYEISQRLLEMGKWLSVNGEAIYGSEAFDLRKDQHDWGKITCKKDINGNTKLYLNVFNWPLNKKLSVTGITTKPTKVYLLADKQKSGLSFTHNQVVTNIELPSEEPDSYISVVVMEFEESPEIVDGLAAKTVSGGYSLTPGNCIEAEGNTLYKEKSGRWGSIPGHIVVDKKSKYIWRIFVEEPMTMIADVSYNFQGKDGDCVISINAAGSKITQTAKHTGQVIVEAGNWNFDNFSSHRIGTINFSEPGYYDINLEVTPNKDEEIGFQWMWLKKQ